MAQQGNLPSQRQRSAPPDGALNLRADAVKDITGSGDLLRSLLNNIPGIVYRGMPDWSLTFVGGEVERLTGYTSREMLGESTLWRSLIHPDDIEPVCESIRNAVCRQERILRVECRIVRKDGEVRWVSDRRQMIYDEGGMLLCVDGLCMDISEQKRAEEERRRLAAAVEYAADAIWSPMRSGSSSMSTPPSRRSRGTRRRKPSGEIRISSRRTGKIYGSTLGSRIRSDPAVRGKGA